MDATILISIAVVIVSAIAYILIKSKRHVEDNAKVVWVIGASSGIGRGISYAGG